MTLLVPNLFVLCSAHCGLSFAAEIAGAEELGEWVTQVYRPHSFRFALHIKNKPPHGKLTLEQAAGYRGRASFMAKKQRWLNYVDFETILIAPQSFILANAPSADQFDRTISYERIAPFVPTFFEALVR